MEEAVPPETEHSNESNTLLSYLVNPWIILFLVSLAFIAKNYIAKLQASYQQASEDGLHHKDPDAVIQRQEAIEAARRRMQEKYDREAKEFAEKQKQKAEAKRREVIEEWEKHQLGQGYKSKVRPTETSSEVTPSTSKPNSNKPKLRPDYNPLTGDSGASCSFRPGRRGPSAGG